MKKMRMAYHPLDSIILEQERLARQRADSHPFWKEEHYRTALEKYGLKIGDGLFYFSPALRRRAVGRVKSVRFVDRADKPCLEVTAFSGETVQVGQQWWPF